MAIAEIEVLNGSGHLSLTWDSENPEEVAAVRAEVARLRAAGYSFFLTADQPADEVAAGGGRLLVRRIEDPTAVPMDDPTEPPPATETEPNPARRGRPRKTVAVQPMRGG